MNTTEIFNERKSQSDKGEAWKGTNPNWCKMMEELQKILWGKKQGVAD